MAMQRVNVETVPDRQVMQLNEDLLEWIVIDIEDDLDIEIIFYLSEC